MTTRRNDRQRGVPLHPLNLAPVLAEAAEYLAEHNTPGIPSTPYQWALGSAPDGTAYLLCDEGVGAKVNPADGASFDLYIDPTDGMALFPSLTTTVSMDELQAMASDQTVDLADFVRRFGARLESNFALWLGILTQPNQERQ